jgi:ABC-2 type transport system permease protein
MATDIQGGFFDRLLTSPASRAAVLGSRLASAFIYACLQTTLVLITLSLFGARVAAGWVGYPLLVFYGGVVGLAGAALMLAFAIRSGQSEVVQSLFPLVFLVLFLSSAFFPVTLMNGWWQTAAEYSPITALVDGARAICIDGLEWGPYGKAIGVAAVLGTLTSLYAASSLRKRLRAS